jgi:hypothetical protein
MLDLCEYKTMAMELMELGAAACIMRMMPDKNLISQREAYREFGEARVKKWASMGALLKKRIGTASRSKILYSRTELLALDKSEKHVKIININSYKQNKKPLKNKNHDNTGTI